LAQRGDELIELGVVQIRHGPERHAALRPVAQVKASEID
jgi:hypothetical protein